MTDETLEQNLRQSLQLFKTRDDLRLRAIRSLVNDFEQPLDQVALAVGCSQETVRRIAKAEGKYARLVDLGPERTRWLGEWMVDYVAAHGANSVVQMLRGAIVNLPRLVKLPRDTKTDIVAA